MEDVIIGDVEPGVAVVVGSMKTCRRERLVVKVKVRVGQNQQAGYQSTPGLIDGTVVAYKVLSCYLVVSWGFSNNVHLHEAKPTQCSIVQILAQA